MQARGKSKIEMPTEPSPWLYNIYAKTREECEEKLAEMITEVKAQIKAEKDKMTG